MLERQRSLRPARGPRSLFRNRNGTNIPKDKRNHLYNGPVAPVLLYQPLAPETRFASEMASTLDRVRARETCDWLSIVPARIGGYSLAVDLAVCPQ